MSSASRAHLAALLASALAEPQRWMPQVGTTWQWQLDGDLDTSVDVGMYDVDFEFTSQEEVEGLKAAGRKVVCYISVGSWENYRGDKDDFPSEVIGNDYYGWEGEKWLDIRQIDKLGPIMKARFDECKAKGFDGVEPDNVDVYTQGKDETGFDITAEDQLTYNKWLVTEAHARGLSIGLKNDPEQVGDLVAHFDWAMTEDCVHWEFCEDFKPFIASGKAVFAAEYTDVGTTLDVICPKKAAELEFSFILKNRDLDAWRQACPSTDEEVPPLFP